MRRGLAPTSSTRLDMASRIEGQRLNVVLQQLRESDERSTIADIEGTRAVEPKGDSGRLPSDRSTEALVVDYVMPVVSNPAIFHNQNIIAMLEHLRDKVLPGLAGDEELKELATKVLDDEVTRHQLLQERRLSSIAS